MLHSVLDFTQHNSSHNNVHENRRIGHEDRMNMPKGIRLEFHHFDGTNPAGWIFEASQSFEFYQTMEHHKLVMGLWLLATWKERP